MAQLKLVPSAHLKTYLLVSDYLFIRFKMDPSSQAWSQPDISQELWVKTVCVEWHVKVTCDIEHDTQLIAT